MYVSLLLLKAGKKTVFYMIEQKGMTFDHNFGYSFPLFSFLLKQREKENENELQKL